MFDYYFILYRVKYDFTALASNDLWIQKRPCLRQTMHIQQYQVPEKNNLYTVPAYGIREYVFDKKKYPKCSKQHLNLLTLHSAGVVSEEPLNPVEWKVFNVPH